MLVKRDAVVRLMTLLLPVLLYAAPAASQDDSKKPRTDGSVLSSKVAPAPVGHRQPKAADIPKDIPKDTTDEERARLDRELDAKLRICRDC